MRSIIFVLFCIAFSPLSFSSENGPFGLAWGMKESDMRANGIEVERKFSKNNVELFMATTLPKNLSMAESYALLVDGRFGLQKVIMVSKNITGDIFGSEGKDAFADLKGKLKGKYGNPTQGVEQVGGKLYDEKDEFYQCLAYDGCGMWAVVFEDKTQGEVVMLVLKGLERGKGFMELTYEGPKWSDVVKARKSDISTSDADAL